jgi:hypothetical protein
MDENRGVLPEFVGAGITLEKSPFVRGFLAGIKGALIGAPTGAAVQLMRGKNPVLGAILGGLGAGVLSGVSRGLAQKAENIDVEEAMRYHALQMKSREPFLFMPPPSAFGSVFRRMHVREHEGFPHAD